eukprot:1192082-Prorocentrum_minimum.AAC.5
MPTALRRCFPLRRLSLLPRRPLSIWPWRPAQPPAYRSQRIPGGEDRASLERQARPPVGTSLPSRCVETLSPTPMVEP